MHSPLIFLALLLLTSTTPASTLTQVCPGVGIQLRTAEFSPGGIILTAFDRANIWLYNIDRNARYPLPDTRPCGVNCRLSPDARWITYINPTNSTYGKMRLDGTERTLITEYANDIEWWDSERLLIWTPGHRAYLQAEGSTDREYLNVQGVVSIQPGGKWGLYIQQEGDHFTRSLLNLETRDLHGIAAQIVNLGEDVPYMNTTAWSPDGQWLAYAAPHRFDPNVQATGAEIFGIQPGSASPTRLTDLFSIYGAVRINGSLSGDLSWSPDARHIAFWVTELLGPDVENNTGSATIHILDIESSELRTYCGFSTNDHTPYTPRLMWSPDSTHIAFVANIPNDDKGYLLLALNTETGVFTELSNGVFPALGRADLIAWGLPPR
jgi:hypothetical protein